jgi:hypothetical protein
MARRYRLALRRAGFRKVGQGNERGHHWTTWQSGQTRVIVSAPFHNGLRMINPKKRRYSVTVLTTGGAK